MKKTNERLNKIAVVIAKVAEIFHWVAVGLLVGGLIAYLFDESLLKYFMDIGNGEFSVWGYSVNVLDETGALIPATFIPALIVGVLVCGLMAMVFRNIYLIFKTTAGETNFSKGATPFQADNVRMLREIGIFVIAIPVLEFVFDIFIKLFVGTEIVESSISLSGLVFGLVLLCLSQFFAYGVELQSDSDGLL